jgi:hypothetical protein
VIGLWAVIQYFNEVITTRDTMRRHAKEASPIWPTSVDSSQDSCWPLYCAALRIIKSFRAAPREQVDELDDLFGSQHFALAFGAVGFGRLRWRSSSQQENRELM